MRLGRTRRDLAGPGGTRWDQAGPGRARRNDIGPGKIRQDQTDEVKIRLGQATSSTTHLNYCPRSSIASSVSPLPLHRLSISCFRLFITPSVPPPLSPSPLRHSLSVSIFLKPPLPSLLLSRLLFASCNSCSRLPKSPSPLPLHHFPSK